MSDLSTLVTDDRRPLTLSGPRLIRAASLIVWELELGVAEPAIGAIGAETGQIVGAGVLLGRVAVVTRLPVLAEPTVEVLTVLGVATHGRMPENTILIVAKVKCLHKLALGHLREIKDVQIVAIIALLTLALEVMLAN